MIIESAGREADHYTNYNTPRTFFRTVRLVFVILPDFHFRNRLLLVIASCFNYYRCLGLMSDQAI